MSEADVRDLLAPLRAAVRWLLEDSCPGDDGLLRYRDTTGSGLANQGWKDSGDSMRAADGSIAQAPIALVEAQAYAVEAARAAARLFEAFGVEGADEIRVWGAALAARVGQRFWVEGSAGRYLAMAIDGRGAPVDGVGSNMGHVLGTGVLDATEAAAVRDVLMSPALTGPLGVSTLSRANPAFNPIGYHTGSIWTHDTAICAWGLAREGFRAEATSLVRALVRVAELCEYRWPELYSGDDVLGRPAPYPASCRPQAWSAASAGVVLSVVLGLDVDVPAGVVRIEPMRPLPFGAVRVEGLRAGPHTFSVDIDADAAVRVEGSLGGLSLEIR